jgi:prepilin-type processing-associated H-X9-DG protein
MYKIIGANQKEYGPVSTDQIRQWIIQGRVNALTSIQAEGSTDWRPLHEFPEFAEALARLSGPPLPGGLSPMVQPVKTSKLAIWSLVLSILGVLTCGITSIVGLVLGIVSLVKINKSKGELGGQGLALAGTIVSGVFVLLLPVWAAMMLPALARAKSKAQTVRCMNNAKQLCLGVIMYADANASQLPRVNAWCDAITNYTRSEEVFKCPAGDQTRRSHYAFNARLQGVRLDGIQLPAVTVLLFETDGGWNLGGGPELLLRKPRHSNAVIVGFADGHVESVTRSRMENLRWDPGRGSGG